MTARHWLLLLFAVAAILRVHNAWVAPPLSGFDGPYHAAYVSILLDEARIPYADEGWSTFHPPFYYALCAGIWWLLPDATPPIGVLFAMRMLGVVASLFLGFAAAGCARLLFPGKLHLPVYAALLTWFLPMHVGAASLLGNEMPAAALAAASIWLTLRCLQEPPSRARVLGLGLVLGLGVLTKFSVLVPLAVSTGALAWSGVRRYGMTLHALQASMLVLVVASVVSGWYFARNVERYGTPVVMQVEKVARVMRLQGYGPPRKLETYVAFPTAILRNPADRSPEALGAVWPLTFATTWYDTYGTLIHVDSAAGRAFGQLLFACGGVAMVLMAVGVVALATSARVAVPHGALAIFALAGLTVLSYVLFTYRVAAFTALKGTYLSSGTVAFALFVALGIERVEQLGEFVQGSLRGFLGIFVVAVTAIFWSGGLAPLPANPAHFYLTAYKDAPTLKTFRFFVGGDRGRLPLAK